MSERFFVSHSISGDRAELIGDEARHLASVMRAKIGDDVVLFDGSGAEFTARVSTIGKHSIELTIIERRAISRELTFSLTLAVALPKGDRQKWLVEKATELGVTRIVPLATERGVAQPVDSALDRLRRSVIEASKQCGRNRLLEIAPPAAASPYFASVPLSATRLLADPAGQAINRVGQAWQQPSAGPPGSAGADASNIIAAIGPEGGFSPAELTAARAANWLTISLGSRILRVETAAIFLAACLGNSK